MTVRFSHPLLGTLVRGAFGPELRSSGDRKALEASVDELNDVAAQLERWRAPGFELRVHAYRGNFTPEKGRVTRLDDTHALVQGATHRAGQKARAHRAHGFEWYVCDDVLALRDGAYLRVLAPRASGLRPWVEETAALQTRCVFPVLRAGGEPKGVPDGGAIELRDGYVQGIARAILGEDAIALDLPLQQGARFQQTVVGFQCAAVDPASRTLPLSPRAGEAASGWLCRVHDPGDAARLASWVIENGGGEALARAAAEVEASFGGVRSVDRTQRFGGAQALDMALAPGSVMPPPLQEAPVGSVIVVSQRDLDNADRFVCLAEDGSLWGYDTDHDEWAKTGDSATTFVSRLALLGHPDEPPMYVARAALGQALAEALGLPVVEEATDSTGTLYAGDAAVIFERRLPDLTVTRMRPRTPEATGAWDAIATGAGGR